MRLRNDDLQVDILPEVGGKVVSLKRVRTGTEFLLAPPDPSRPYPFDVPGAPFTAFDMSGFDECFPTVGACASPRSGRGPQSLPDHGELWSRPWEVVEHGEHVMTLRISSTHLPCTLERTLRLDGPVLEARYTLTNQQSAPLPYLWSAHPLLACDEGDGVWLPPSVSGACVEYSHDDRLGPRGSAVDASALGDLLRHLAPGPPARAEKLFIEGLEVGHAALVRRARGEVLHVRFDLGDISGLGLWVCQGLAPPSPDPDVGLAGPGHFTVAIEPCRGWPDCLDDAMRRGTNPTLVSRDTWTVRLEPADLDTLPDWGAPSS